MQLFVARKCFGHDLSTEERTFRVLSRAGVIGIGTWIKDSG